MPSQLQALFQEIRELEDRVSEEISREAEQLGYNLRRGRVRFEQEILQRHRAMAKSVRRYLAESSLGVIATAPLVYSLLIPLVALDVFMWVYQAVCFRVYGIPRVKRSEYVVIDRHHLRYLNVIERFHCVYCSYANGLIAYALEVVARTEQYWCPIKHTRRQKILHSRYHAFLSYGDAEGYADRLQEIRKQFEDIQP